MAANMYRVGDYVYFETSSTTPYQIRRIEELNKTPNGNVEAKVMCFYRRRDIASSLIILADKHQIGVEDDAEVQQKDDLSEKQRHQLKHRELFLSRQVETLPATHIRGKCAVTLLNETESLLSYLNKEDAFFYSLVYDPQQKTLLADKGEIRVGNRFQADVGDRSLLNDQSDDRKMEDMEDLVWDPNLGQGDKEIDQFMVIARSVGTFARALDCTSTVRQPSLHMSAAAASRDITLFHAMDALHKHNYNNSKAIASLVPSSGPVLCRDEMEEWSASEANLFEEALDKYGKDFNDIRQDFLPWKSLKCIVEYYYMWKTTDRYVQQKRIKAREAESKLKQVYIPNYNKPNPAQITGKMNGLESSRSCESCRTTHSNQWYSWGPVHMQCRLCAACWIYWKKYGGLKTPTRLGGSELDGERPGPNQRQDPVHKDMLHADRLAQLASMRTHKCTISGCGKEFRLRTHLARHLTTAHGLAIQPGSPRPVMKTRTAFCLITTPLTRASRQLCKDILKIRRAGKNPFYPINIALIKQECQDRLAASGGKIRELRPQKRGTLNTVVKRMGVNIDVETPSLLRRIDIPRREPVHYAFPAKSAEEMRAFHAVQQQGAAAARERSHSPQVQGSLPQIMRKRGYEQTNGMDASPAAKRSNLLGVIRQAGNVKQPSAAPPRGTVINHLNGREGKAHPIRNRKGLSWVDSQDDAFFLATDATRKMRKQLPGGEFKRVARKPWRKLKVPFGEEAAGKAIVILD